GLADVILVLGDDREHPVKVTADHLTVAVFADARAVDAVQRRAAARAAGGIARFAVRAVGTPDQRPVFAEAPGHVFAAGHQPAGRIDLVLAHGRVDAHGDGVEPSVVFDLGDHDLGDLQALDHLANAGFSVAGHPVTHGIEQRVRDVGAHARLALLGPGLLQLAEHVGGAVVEHLPVEARV